jgi:hypothetical protein
MSSPPPIIPQTPEQAIQRDQIAGLKPVPLDDPRAELARLQQAVRDHHEATTQEGLDGYSRDTANSALWRHIGETG